MSAGEPRRWRRRLRRGTTVALLVVLVLWIALVAVVVVTFDDDGFLYVPYGDYVTTVALTEYRGSGCGRRAEIWTARDLTALRRTTVEVCDTRVWPSADEGDVLRVGTRDALTRVSDSILYFSLFAIVPIVLVMIIVENMLLTRGGRGATAEERRSA